MNPRHFSYLDFRTAPYYLAGYAIECALKVCIAKRTHEHDFPEKKYVNDSHTHDLWKLVQLAELQIELEVAMQGDAAMRAGFDIIKDWSETSRYDRKATHEASDLLKAIDDPAGGLLPWIRQRW